MLTMELILRTNKILWPQHKICLGRNLHNLNDSLRDELEILLTEFKMTAVISEIHF
jgi:hypothetical protein